MSGAGFLGIDVGSISTNLVVIDAVERDVVYESYVRGSGSPIESVQHGLAAVAGALPTGFEIRGVSVTGSGRSLIGALVGADVIKNEITAHARAAIHLHPEVQTVCEIGGQDSKVTVIRDGNVVDFAMNLVCAAGTGSFLDSQAKRLGIAIDAFSARAMESANPTTIAGRCTVFAESDMIHKQQVGHQQCDIIMGLCHAMVRNFLSNVCRGKDIQPPVIFQGGVSANQGIRRAFEEALGYQVFVPRYNMVMGAYGAALLASTARIAQTKFRGFEISEHAIQTQAFECDDCPNTCEIVEIIDEECVVSRSGGRCRKWEGNTADRATVQGTPPLDDTEPAPTVTCEPVTCATDRRAS